MRKPIESTGFRPPSRRALGRERRTAVFAELAATVALALCTLIAVTALSVGIASAGVADGIIGNEISLFAIALLLGLIFIGIGGLTVLSGGKSRYP